MKRYLLLLTLLGIALRRKIVNAAQTIVESFGEICASARDVFVNSWAFINAWNAEERGLSLLFTDDALPFWVVVLGGLLLIALALRGILILCSKSCEGMRKSTGDEPIISSREDKLGRIPYVKSLCKIIKTWGGIDSQVIGIFGEWGEGKTSVINLFAEKYCRGRRREFDLVRFCPWHSVDRRNINSELFGCIGSQLGIFHNPGLALKFMVYAQKTSAHFLAGADSLSSLVFSVFTWLLSSSSSRDHLKKSISEELQKKKRRLIVVLDDVDRLSKDEVVELVRCLKTNADFPKTTYLLLSDAKRLADMIESEVGSAEDGVRYLEKIVQCSYPLWPISVEMLRRESIAALNDVLKDYNNPVSSDLTVALEFCLEKAKNLRQIKRVVYAFKESLAYYYSMIEGESDSPNQMPLNIELGDALRLAALRVIEPGCAERVYGFYEKYINMGSAIGELDYRVDHAEYEKLCDSVRKDNKEWFKSFLTDAMLLEEVPSVNQTAIIASGIKKDGQYTGFRLASPKSFRRYFNSSEMPRGLIPRRDRIELLSAIQDDGRMENATTTAHAKWRLFYILEVIIANNDYTAIEDGALSFVQAADFIVKNLDKFEAYEEGSRYRLAYDACNLAVENIVRVMRDGLLSLEKECAIAEWIIENKSYALGLFVLHCCAGQLEPNVEHHIDKINGVMVEKIWPWIKADLSCKVFDVDIEKRNDSELIQKFYMLIILEKLPVDMSTFKDNCEYFIASMDSSRCVKRLRSLVTFQWDLLRDGISKTRRNLIGSYMQFFIKVLNAAENFVLKHQDETSVEDLRFLKEMSYGYQTEKSFEMSKLFERRLKS